MGKSFIRLSLIFFLPFLLLSACAGFPIASLEANSVEETEQPEDTLTKIRQRDKIIIGVSTDSPPFAFLDSEGKNIGLEVDIARFITKEILGSVEKVQFIPIFDPSKRIEFLRTKKIDLAIASIRDLPQNKQEIDLSRHYYSSGFGFLTRKNNGINSWRQLKGQTVCAFRGGYWNKALSRMGFELIDFRSFNEVDLALEEERCIGLVSSHARISAVLQDPEWSEQWHQALPLILSVPWSMGLPKGDDSFKQAVDDAILKMESKAFLVTREAQWNIPTTGYVQKQAALAKIEIGILDANRLQDLTIDKAYDNNILIDGSPIISPLSDRIATKYEGNNDNIKIVVGRSGTNEGIKKLCHGEIDIANASRGMNQAEIELCLTNGIEYNRSALCF
ncbi:periplasmic component of amino acid ABC-type transporter/signal transduction system [Xenococcus sp. PCC 7305]|uniref:transporter substrate-binding domain-containing protein n=1 Tax=Xenococcus sp. PCC 7305 TaxID=102125 RepID=UPI0002ACF7C6|nr:transporter substrate-binding domain-containing protein [Xenococcus sp. PCC 7305]ELS00651.1 periplasmic component of amino acid ABC-type transporter/signal transduction system [Xenococcus sp. PCC 7305]